MGASHLLFAAAATGYVAVGLVFEERDLRRTFGTAYDEYAARVPSLVPGPPGRAENPRLASARPFRGRRSPALNLRIAR